MASAALAPLRIVFPAAVAAAGLALAFEYVARNGVAELAARYQLIDDAFYYLEIANNLRAGCGSSFDCLNPTNGYHPLWLLLLVPLTAAVPEPGDAQVWLMLGVGIALYLAACVVVTQTAIRLMPGARLAPILPAILLAANPSQFFVAVNGLETPVAFLTLALLLDAVSRALTPPSGPIEPGQECPVPFTPALAVVAAGAAAFLARLDYAIVAALAVGLLFLEDFRRRARPAPALAAGAILAAAVLAYLLINLVLFGAAMPVSGAIKQDRLLDGFDLGHLSGPAAAVSALFWPLRFVVGPGSPWVLLLALIPTFFAVRFAWRSPARLRDLFLALQGWVHAALYLTLQSSGPEYYFVPLVLSVAWSSAVMLRAIEQRLPPRARIAGAGILMALALAAPLAAGAVLDRERPVVRWRLDRLQAVAWMNEALPADALIGSWWAGAVGYYSRLRVVNLDGLVNSPAFLDVLRGCRLGSYIRARGIAYMADYMTFAMVRTGTADETLFPGRCWAELRRDLKAAGWGFEALRIYPDPDHPRERGFVVLRLRRP